MRTNHKGSVKYILILLCVIMVFIGIGGCMAGMPQYRVYQKKLAGQAAYAEAQSSRQIRVLEAQAKLESAGLEARAEIERAKGVASANKIIGTSLQGNEVYLHYLWIQNMNEKAKDTIYIPTEGNMPIMESTRRLEQQVKAFPPAK